MDPPGLDVGDRHQRTGRRGRTSHLTTKDRVAIVERLRAFGDADRFCSYPIDSGLFPIQDYVATQRVSEHPQGSQMLWNEEEFTVIGGSDPDVQQVTQRCMTMEWLTCARGTPLERAEFVEPFP